MDLLLQCVVCALLLTSALCSDENLELPAFEYKRQLKVHLDLGECPRKIVQHITAPPTTELCTFPDRHGKHMAKDKPINIDVKTVLQNTTDLFKYLPLCDADAASYFGLLAQGDCVSSEIAQELSFKDKTAVLMSLDHYRPRLKYLKADSNLHIPDEFTLYLNNSYYTEKIGVGTEEAIILELWYKNTAAARQASSPFYTQRLSERLQEILKGGEKPRKIKVITMSTSDSDLKTKVFKKNEVTDVVRYVQWYEKEIERKKLEFRFNRRRSALTYTFKKYEIGPVAASYSSVTEEQKRQAWEEIALLQVETKRIYKANKKYRKFCKGTKLYKKYCLLTKQTIKELRKTITHVHTQRRDWTKLIYESQIDFITTLRSKLNLLDNRMRMVSSFLRKAMKKSNMS